MACTGGVPFRPGGAQTPHIPIVSDCGSIDPSYPLTPYARLNPRTECTLAQITHSEEHGIFKYEIIDVRPHRRVLSCFDKSRTTTRRTRARTTTQAALATTPTTGTPARARCQLMRRPFAAAGREAAHAAARRPRWRAACTATDEGRRRNSQASISTKAVASRVHFSTSP